MSDLFPIPRQPRRPRRITLLTVQLYTRPESPYWQAEIRTRQLRTRITTGTRHRVAADEYALLLHQQLTKTLLATHQS